MFENLGSRVAAGRRSTPLALEALEDRTTPAVTGPTGNLMGAFSAVDRMFVADAARFSLLESSIGGLEAIRGSTPQARAFGVQLAASHNAGFVQELPLLVQAGLSLQLTATDGLLIRDLPALTGPSAESQILMTSAVVQIQAVALFQAEAAFGTNATARAFAQGALPLLQGELQTALDLIGPSGTAFTLSMFNQVGPFGTSSVLGTSGVVGQFGTNATLNSALGTSLFGGTTAGTFGASNFGGTFGGTVSGGTFGGTTSGGTFGGTTSGGTFGGTTSGGTAGTFGSGGPFGFGT